MRPDNFLCSICMSYFTLMSVFCIGSKQLRADSFKQKSSDLVISAQRTKNLDSSYGLTSGLQLFGQSRMNGQSIFNSFYPHLSGLKLKIVDQSESKKFNSYYQRFHLYHQGYQIFSAYFVIHYLNGELNYVRGNIPATLQLNVNFSDDDFDSLDELGYGHQDFPEGSFIEGKKVLYESYGELLSGWEVYISDPSEGTTQIKLINANSSELIKTMSQKFELGLASVYQTSSEQRIISDQNLIGLKGSGFLDGENFTVFSPNKDAPRAKANNGDFFYSPATPDEMDFFDQVQVYYGASTALEWFKTKFDYKPGNFHLTIRINQTEDFDVNNALYDPKRAEIVIGPGDGYKFRNLARDSDVVIHEFGHHVIHRYVKAVEGEPGSFHEGTADYFAYAINKNPLLAESIVTESDYLRTALLAPGMRYDDPSNRKSEHFLGQFWSAVLWEVRRNIGESFDETVFRSLKYLGPNSGFEDAFLALLNADLEMRPKNSKDPEFGLYGESKCVILNAAIERGFAVFLEDLDGSSCGLDLVALARESRLYRDKFSEKNIKKTKKTVLGQNCGVIFNQTKHPVTSRLWLILLLCLPAGIALFKALNANRRTI